MATSPLEVALRSVDPGQWALEQLVILDWYDGPAEGIAALSTPSCHFYYKVVDERRTPTGLADRLYRISELDAAAFERAISILEAIEPRRRPVWSPPWTQVPEGTEARLEEVLAHRRDTSLVVLSNNMEEFQGIYDLAPVSGRSAQPAARIDWFERLGLR